MPSTKLQGLGNSSNTGLHAATNWIGVIAFRILRVVAVTIVGWFFGASGILHYKFMDFSYYKLIDQVISTYQAVRKETRRCGDQVRINHGGVHFIHYIRDPWDKLHKVISSVFSHFSVNEKLSDGCMF